MKHRFIYPASLSLLLAVSPAFGDGWERHMGYRAMAQDAPAVTGRMGHNWHAVELNRRRQLGRGMDRDFDREQGFDIESLPPTAAGPGSMRRMGHDWEAVRAHRSMHFERSL